MEKPSKAMKLVKITDAERSGTEYVIAPDHAKVIGVLRDMIEIARSQDGEEDDPVIALTSPWLTMRSFWTRRLRWCPT